MEASTRRHRHKHKSQRHKHKSQRHKHKHKSQRHKQKSKGCVVLFHRHGCGWCESMAGAWAHAVASVPGACVLSVEGGQVQAGSVPTIAARAAATHVLGYPTILALSTSGDVVATHDGERTSESFAAFIRKHAGRRPPRQAITRRTVGRR